MLTYRQQIANLSELSHALTDTGISDITLEYPAYLAIAHNGLEFYAGYDDDQNFSLTHNPDGADGNYWEFPADNLSKSAQAIANAITKF